jgi:hypothetical protein
MIRYVKVCFCVASVSFNPVFARPGLAQDHFKRLIMGAVYGLTRHKRLPTPFIVRQALSYRSTEEFEKERDLQSADSRLFILAFPDIHLCDYVIRLTRSIGLGSICHAPDGHLSDTLAAHPYLQRLRLHPTFTNRNPDGLFFRDG